MKREKKELWEPQQGINNYIIDGIWTGDDIWIKISNWKRRYSYYLDRNEYRKSLKEQWILRKKKRMNLWLILLYWRVFLFFFYLFFNSHNGEEKFSLSARLVVNWNSDKLNETQFDLIPRREVRSEKRQKKLVWN